MFICPKCNTLVADPDYLPPPPPWRRLRGSPGTPNPVCPSGHKLRSPVLGDLSELSLARAIFRGLLLSATTLALGMLEDLRKGPTGRPHLGLMLMTATGLILGTIAFNSAWKWAGATGPVHRLASRALGTAVGDLVPAIAASHALYFHWADAAQTAFYQGIFHLVHTIRKF